MPAELSDRALGMLEDLPPYLREDPNVQGVVAAAAAEFARIEEFLGAVRLAGQPGRALEAGYRFLALWEAQLGLPVEPDAPAAQRQARVAARVRSRQAGAGRDWVASIAALIGASWTYTENFPDPNRLLITVPYASGSDQAEQVRELARQISPAHVDVVIQHGAGFLVGVSEVGVDPI
jgi:hypothetical protein